MLITMEQLFALIVLGVQLCFEGISIFSEMRLNIDYRFFGLQ